MSVNLMQLLERLWSFISTIQPILSPIEGVLVGVFIREIADFFRKPRLSIEIDLSALKPFSIAETPHFAKYWRLRIKNSGRRPAQYSEAKFEAFDESDNSLFDPSILHWVRRYPVLYSKEQTLLQFEPITINSKDHEYLDVIQLVSLDHQTHPGRALSMSTYSHRPFQFKPHAKYVFKVTIYSRNANPLSSKFCLQWDDTWEGFDKNSISACK